MILEALEQLRSSYEFELILVENKTHEEALEIYRSADLSIDNVLGGWYGGVAVEMMAMGKPVLCHIREEDMKFIPEAMRRELPFYNVDPGTLAADFAAVLDRRSEWEARGRDARRYVERWHDPDFIAAAMIAAYASPSSTFILEPKAA